VRLPSLLPFRSVPFVTLSKVSGDSSAENEFSSRIGRGWNGTQGHSLAFFGGGRLVTVWRLARGKVGRRREKASDKRAGGVGG
jgi:hypothetical protein